jgi:hypothetical protein
VSGVDFVSLMKKIYLNIRNNGVGRSPWLTLLQFQPAGEMSKVAAVHLWTLLVQGSIVVSYVERCMNMPLGSNNTISHIQERSHFPVRLVG